MLLKEFFGRSLDLQSNERKRNDKLRDELFQFVIEHDRLHKDYFFPIARKIKLAQKQNTGESNFTEEFLPMVKKGCLEFYHKKNMMGKPEKVFTKDLQEEMCERLYNHYYEDIIKDHYKL